MSLVGTRPPTVDEWDKYELHHRARLATKPGLTGMWQVSGRSNITDYSGDVDALGVLRILEACRILGLEKKTKVWGDPTKAKTVLGWNPQKTSYEELVEIMAKHDRTLAKKEAAMKNA